MNYAGGSLPKVLYSTMPIIWFKPAEDSQMSVWPHFSMGTYRTAARRGVLSTTGHSTNFVMEIRVPTTRDSQHWIKRGVALLCSLSD